MADETPSSKLATRRREPATSSGVEWPHSDPLNRSATSRSVSSNSPNAARASLSAFDMSQSCLIDASHAQHQHRAHPSDGSAWSALGSGSDLLVAGDGVGEQERDVEGEGQQGEREDNQ